MLGLTLDQSRLPATIRWKLVTGVMDPRFNMIKVHRCSFNIPLAKYRDPIR